MKKKLLLLITVLLAALLGGCALPGAASEKELSYREQGIGLLEAGEYELAIEMFDLALEQTYGFFTKTELDICYYKALSQYKNGDIIAPAQYQKIIMAGRSGWIVQRKNKYGIMDSKGNYLVEPKFRYADRILGRYIKLGNDKDFGIYNEFGEEILPAVYTSIDLLYGKMFLTYSSKVAKIFLYISSEPYSSEVSFISRFTSKSNPLFVFGSNVIILRELLPIKCF